MAEVRDIREVSEAQPETRLQSLASLCGTLVVGLFVLTFVAQNFLIPSASMASTLLVGDHVIADRASLSPATGWARFEQAVSRVAARLGAGSLSLRQGRWPRRMAHPPDSTSCW